MSKYSWNQNTPMGTPPTVPRKTAFPGASSSSSSGYKEVELLDLEQPSPQMSHQKPSSKEIEAKSRKIIIDLDDDDDEVMIIDTCWKRCQRKGAVRSWAHQHNKWCIWFFWI